MKYVLNSEVSRLWEAERNKLSVELQWYLGHALELFYEETKGFPVIEGQLSSKKLTGVCVE